VKRKKYFDAERAFQFIWENADSSGLWCGDAVTLAAEFDVSEDIAESILEELCDRRLIEKLYTRTYFISKWREKDESGEGKGLN
jgi:hypothetical protein